MTSAAVAAVALAIASPASGATRKPLERFAVEDDAARLSRGETLRRNVDVDLDDGSYFGGLAYAVIDAPPSVVMADLMDPASWTSILPMTKEARVVKRFKGLMFLRLTHGGNVASASYTAIVKRESAGLVRFWLDPNEPHDVADCWGYFRVTAWGNGKSLLSYGALLHLDFGFLRMFFTEKIRDIALETPELVREYVMFRRREAR